MALGRPVIVGVVYGIYFFMTDVVISGLIVSFITINDLYGGQQRNDIKNYPPPPPLVMVHQTNSHHLITL